MLRRSFSNDYKIKLVKQFLKIKVSGGSINELAELVDIRVTTINRWIREYQDGKLTDSGAYKKTNDGQIDYTEHLVSISKTLLDILQLLKNVVKGFEDDDQEGEMPDNDENQSTLPTDLASALDKELNGNG